jgi:hypothetical protein
MSSFPDVAWVSRPCLSVSRACCPENGRSRKVGGDASLPIGFRETPAQRMGETPMLHSAAALHRELWGKTAVANDSQLQ